MSPRRPEIPDLSLAEVVDEIEKLTQAIDITHLAYINIYWGEHRGTREDPPLADLVASLRSINYLVQAVAKFVQPFGHYLTRYAEFDEKNLHEVNDQFVRAELHMEHVTQSFQPLLWSLNKLWWDMCSVERLLERARENTGDNGDEN